MAMSLWYFKKKSKLRSDTLRHRIFWRGCFKFLQKILQIPLDNIDEIEGIYLVECRKYKDKADFRHYRAFFLDADVVYSYFETYINDEEINVEGWYDVTEEF